MWHLRGSRESCRSYKFTRATRRIRRTRRRWQDERGTMGTDVGVRFRSCVECENVEDGVSGTLLKPLGGTAPVLTTSLTAQGRCETVFLKSEGCHVSQHLETTV